MADGFFGNGMLDPRAGNDRRKALLQMLMQKGGRNIDPGFSGQAGNAAGATPFGGMRAVAKNRDTQGQSFTHPAQVAAQFLGGLGVGSRPGADQGGSNGAAVQRFLPSGGGPVERHVGPQAPQAPIQGGPAPASPAAGSNAAGVPNNSTYDSLGLAQTPGPISSGGPGNTFGDPSQPFGSTPTTGAANLIPLGNGAYFNPATGQVHYPTGGTSTAMAV